MILQGMNSGILLSGFQPEFNLSESDCGAAGFDGVVAANIAVDAIKTPLILQRNLPLTLTILVFIAGCFYCLKQYPGFPYTRVMGNLLTDNVFLGIMALGMTFVILSGGIDLSVGSTIAFTGVLLAKMILEYGVPPGLIFVIQLMLGALYVTLTGWIIDALRLPVFIITPANMFFLRGMRFSLSRESVLLYTRGMICWLIMPSSCPAADG